MSPNSTSLAIQHAIYIVANNEVLLMDEFSSRKFSILYLNNVIPGSVKLYMLQITDAYNVLLDAITNCINYINQNDGFTVIGWYKKGVINDKGLLASKVGNVGTSSGNHNNSASDEEIQVDAGEISYHIVHHIQTNRELLDPNTMNGSLR